MDGESVLRCKLLDQLAHFSVAHNREFRSDSYSNDAGSGVRKNSRWSDSIARCRSAAATTMYYPSPILTTDNAAMIAAAGTPKLRKGAAADLSLNAYADLPLC